MEFKKKNIIAVIGQGSNCSQKILALAEEVGKEIAKRDGIVICGGLKGVMEAVCRGAKQENGLTIGVIPGTQKSDANKFVDIPIVTGIGEARNSIIVRTADAVIAVGGKYGTLSEISFSLAFNKPVIGLNTWENIEGIIYRDSPVEAVEEAFNKKK
ncbi:TIGR00725 family protein [candidate division KSB1 bacterium]|nr:TIGR00725 family protein [candidate division KSB1 bacterium]MBL7093187.1 TIGR00725 family protein [candidate division KSB1 bacterium]